MAELSFNMHYSPHFVSVGAAGFSDKLAVLLETMLRKMLVFEIEQKRFDSIVEDVSAPSHSSFHSHETLGSGRDFPALR